MADDDNFEDRTNENSPFSNDRFGGDRFTEGDFQAVWSIWTNPRETIRRIVATDPERNVVLLSCLFGISNSLDRASSRHAGDELPLGAILMIAVVLGPLGGLLSVWLSSWLVTFTGDWLGGRGYRDHIKAAVAWATIPLAFGLVLWIPLVLMLGQEAFTKETPLLDTKPWLEIPVLLIGITGLVLGIWALVLECKTIAEVQGYRSAWRGLGNIMLAGLVVVAPVILIATLMTIAR